MSVRVLIVDDHELVRAGFRMLLDPAPEVDVVGEAADGATGVAEARRLRPEVVLMDVRMPDLDGIEATRQIVALDGAPVRVLMLTTFDLTEYLLEAVRAGVSGFTLKDTPPEELIAGILAAARGDALVAPETTVALIESITRAHAPSSPAGIAELTGAELDVLRRLARGQSDARIAEALGVEAAAVTGDVARVLAKLGVRERVQAALVAYEARAVTAP